MNCAPALHQKGWYNLRHATLIAERNGAPPRTSPQGWRSERALLPVNRATKKAISVRLRRFHMVSYFRSLERRVSLLRQTKIKTRRRVYRRLREGRREAGERCLLDGYGSTHRTKERRVLHPQFLPCMRVRAPIRMAIMRPCCRLAISTWYTNRHGKEMIPMIARLDG
jgi:hypothetical protein